MLTPRKRWIAAAALGVLATLRVPAMAQERLDGGTFEEGFFELAVDHLPERSWLITMVDADGRVLLPLRSILDHVGIPVREESDSLVLEWPPDVWSTVVRPGDRSVATAADTTVFGPEEWLERDGSLYVAAEVVGRILHAAVDVRFADLVVHVSESGELPEIRRRLQEARRAAATAPEDTGPRDRYDDVPYPARTGGLAAGWGLSVANGSDATHLTYRTTLGASILGGATELGATGAVDDRAASGAADLFARHTRVFSGSPWVRRLDLGTVATEGTVARPVTGFTLTNGPLVTPRYFGETVIAPPVPAGWEYEVYQGEHLVGVSGADDAGVRAPLDYGTNPVTVRLLGPAGQEIEQDLVYVVPTARVTPGLWLYSLGGGACREPGCDQYYFAEVNRGLTSTLSAGAGGEWMTSDSTSTLAPFGKIGFSPRPDVSAELQLRGSSFARAGVQWVGSDQGSLSASYAWTGDEHGALGSAGWIGQGNATTRLPLFGGRWASARLLMRGRRSGQVDSWQARLSSTIERTHVAVEVESGLQARSLTTLRAFHTIVHGLPDFVDYASLTGAVSVGSHGFELGEIGTSIRTGPKTQVDARIRLQADREPTLSLGVSLRSGVGFFQARSNRGASNGAYVAADGGLAYTPDAGVMTRGHSSVGWAGLTGTVFHDLDGDGRRGPDEPVVVGADVVSAGSRATTDETGRFRVWGLTPYEGVSVSVDPLSLEHEWAPPETDVRLRPSPNTFNAVDLPVHRTREVMGSVISRDGRPLGGVLVEIVDESGTTVARTRTFSDGVYYLDRLRPGAYLARLGGTWGAVGTSISDMADGSGESWFVVPHGPGSAAIELDPLHFDRRAEQR